MSVSYLTGSDGRNRGSCSRLDGEALCGAVSAVLAAAGGWGQNALLYLGNRKPSRP